MIQQAERWTGSGKLAAVERNKPILTKGTLQNLLFFLTTSLFDAEFKK